MARLIWFYNNYCKSIESNYVIVSLQQQENLFFLLLVLKYCIIVPLNRPNCLFISQNRHRKLFIDPFLEGKHAPIAYFDN